MYLKVYTWHVTPFACHTVAFIVAILTGNLLWKREKYNIILSRVSDLLLVQHQLFENFSIEMFYLNTIEQLFLFVEQLFLLEVCLPYSRFLAGIPILAVFQNLRWNSNKTPLSVLGFLNGKILFFSKKLLITSRGGVSHKSNQDYFEPFP